MRAPPIKNNFVVIARMIMELGTGIKFDVFYKMVKGLNFRCSLCPNPFTKLAEIWYLEVFWGVCYKYRVRFYF